MCRSMTYYQRIESFDIVVLNTLSHFQNNLSTIRWVSQQGNMGNGT